MIDARTIDGPADDVDGDGVKNTADNCPGVANMGQFDEDGDLKGDECDPCPHLTGAADDDGDTDGVGNGCDPRPGTSGDKLAYWNGFHVASASLPDELVMIHGQAARWSIAGGFLVFDSTDDEWGMPAVNVGAATHSIDTQFEITASYTGTAAAAGVAVDVAADDTDMFECQARTDAGRRELWRRVPAAPDGWSNIVMLTANTPNDIYRVIFHRTAGDLACTTTRQGQISVDMTSSLNSANNTRAGLFARNVDAKFKYVAVYTSP